jgi:hypothetical protein
MAKSALALCITILAALSAVLEAKSYSADRFDSQIEVLRGGSIRVVETVVLRFDGGTFTQYYRVIPVRNTDGVEIESASMDGDVLPAGKDSGQVEISGRDRIRVTWHFAPVSNASHRFDLVYVVRGAVRQEANADVLAWRSLPTEHQYAIRGSMVDLSLPAAPLATPSVELHRVADSSVTLDGSHARITATDIRGNGWLEPSVRLPRGTVLDAPPAWQQRAAAARALARYWIIAAGLVVLLGLALLLATRQGYDSPSGSFAAVTSGSTPPDTLPAAIAGPLVTNGAPRLEHAMAALFAMADRGELAIEERPRSLGHRNFAISHLSSSRSLEPYEQAVLDLSFGGRQNIEPWVSLGKARERLTRQFRKFSIPLQTSMLAAGLLDEGRRAVRKRFGAISVTAVALAALAVIPAGVLVRRFEGWPFLICGALAIVAVLAASFYAAHTPLSNEGLRRAQHWRAFRQYLRDVARDRQPSPADSDARRLLPIAVALGVAPAWSAYLKRHRAAAPRWFRAIDGSGSDPAAFATLVAIGGAGGGGGAHGGGAGAAAGGGASGAS